MSRLLRRAACGTLAFCILGIQPAARAIDLSRPDAHAPIGVMGDHVHRAGELMLSYRAMYMDMHGSRNGTSNRSRGEVLADFPVAPTAMRMAMHMFGLMYAPTDDLTLMVMVPYLRLNMDHVTRMGAHFTTAANSLGDTELSALVSLRRSESAQLHANLGLSLPTGDFNQRDPTPAGRTRLPYPMQTGSGSFELRPGLTYNHQWARHSAGAQALATLRLHQNRNDYQLGNEIELNVWGARRLGERLSLSLRGTARAWGNVHGADRALVQTLVPTADPDRRAGRRFDLGLGANWLFTKGALAGHRLAAEANLPVWESLDGPQLETDWVITLGWQKAF